MHRRLFFFPTVAAVCWAQQTSPEADAARQALTERVQAYYKLMMEKKYRQAESMVAEESKEDYYNGKKPDIRGFDLAGAVLNDDLKTAKVTIKAKVRLLMPGAGAQVFEMPSPTYWKLENGVWCWYVPEEVKRMTPFGKLQSNEGGGGADGIDGKGKAPSLGTMLGQVRIDRTAVEFSPETKEQKVVIVNGLPGPLTLRVDPHVATIKGLSVTVDKPSLDSGEKATVLMKWDGAEKLADVVTISTLPLNRSYNITVMSK